jgi:protein-disulfide isomerase
MQGAYHMFARKLSIQMKTGQQRGRAARRQRSGVPRSFYILLAAIALVGIAALVAVVLRSRQAAVAPGTPVDRPPLQVPIGQMPDGFWYKGKLEAAVTVVEYADFQCPGCGFFANQLEPRFSTDYIESGKVRFVFHDYPLSFHANAIPAAEAARCAGEQGAFWPMHDLLFANQAQWTTKSQPLAQFAVYAEQLKLDRAALEQCMTSGKHREEVLKAQQAGDQLGLPGTPSFAVNGALIDTQGLQTIDEIADRLRQTIDAALTAKK